MKLQQRWHHFWFDPEAPLNLGICRALFYAGVLLAYARTDFAAYAQLGPRSAFWDPIWLFSTMHVPVLSQPVLEVLQVVWKIAIVMACIGCFTSASTVVTCILGTYLVGITCNYGKVEHQAMPMTVVMGILALSRCGAGFSIDALLRKARGKPAPAPSGEYRWPVRAVWLLLAITFCAAGIAKLRYNGIRWATGPGFGLLLLSRLYDPNPPALKFGTFVAAQPWLAHMLAMGSLAMETFFPLALFDRRLRRLLPLGTFSMQLGIGLLMNVWFVQFLVIYAFWVPWGNWFGKKSDHRNSRLSADCAAQ